MIQSISDSSLIPYLLSFRHSTFGNILTAVNQKLLMFSQNIPELKSHIDQEDQITIKSTTISSFDFEIKSINIRTYQEKRTEILVGIKPLSENATPLFGVSFRLHSSGQLKEDSYFNIPCLNQECQLQFNITPKKIGTFKLPLTCEFSTLDGQIQRYSFNQIIVEPYALLSPSKSSFEEIWSNSYQICQLGDAVDF
jgi:hypothetical protein